MDFRGNNAIIDGFDDEKDDGLSIVLERCERDPGCIKIHLSNRIDNYNSVFFQRAANKVIAAGYRHLLFCCHGLNYVSSTGIGAFTYLLKALQTTKRDMVLVGVQAKVYDVFELLGFTSFFSFYDTDEAALVAIRAKEAGVATASVFPLTFNCPKCSNRLRTAKPGKFLCSICKTRIVVSQAGKVQIWDGVG